MRKIEIEPRPFWQKRVESLGFGFHTIDGTPYWDESCYYEISLEEANIIENATTSLFEMYMQAAEYVIDNGILQYFGIDEWFADLIVKSYRMNDFSIYGRFDLAWNGTKGTFPKLLEFNADTPTSLFEAAVIQWDWVQSKFQEKDQFNSLHSKLIETWRAYKSKVGTDTLYFAVLTTSQEDYTNVHYLMDCAHQAGLKTRIIHIKDIGWNGRDFIDEMNQTIKHIFKLYPWEWLFKEEFGPFIGKAEAKWIEPPWKYIINAKVLLPVLWKLFPDSPYRLPCFDYLPTDLNDYVKKPYFSREGANIEIVKKGQIIAATGGEYGKEGFVYQQFAPLFSVGNSHAVIGSWVIDGKAAGIGFRESYSPITDNFCRFMPHVISG